MNHFLPNNNSEKEIIFIEKEFANSGEDNYIKNELLNDLIIFSYKDKTYKLLEEIINLIDSFKNIKEDIQETEFYDILKQNYEILSQDEVNEEEIKNAIVFLEKYKYDIKNETPLIKFYEFLLGKEEAISFIKTIKNEILK